MAIHKLQLDDFASTNYELFAIHSNLEDHKLAYFLNKELILQLEKSKTDIELKTKNGKSCFNYFWFNDEQNGICWHLIDNKSKDKMTTENFGLFESVSVTQYLVPEHKKADYILKVDNTDNFFETKNVLKKIQAIPLIVLLYTIETDKLKSKNNLIF